MQEVYRSDNGSMRCVSWAGGVYTETVSFVGLQTVGLTICVQVVMSCCIRSYPPQDLYLHSGHSCLEDAALGCHHLRQKDSCSQETVRQPQLRLDMQGSLPQLPHNKNPVWSHIYTHQISSTAVSALTFNKSTMIPIS